MAITEVSRFTSVIMLRYYILVSAGKSLVMCINISLMQCVSRVGAG